MKNFLVIQFLFTPIILFGQKFSEYKKIEVQPVAHTSENYKGIDLVESYLFDNFEIFVGLESAKWMIIIEDNKKEIARIPGPWDSYSFSLNFFKTTNSSDPILVFGRLGSEFYWGEQVVIMYEDKAMNAGDLLVGRYHEGEETEEIIDYLIIKRFPEYILIEFDCDDLIIDPSNLAIRIKSKENLRYYIKENSLIEIRNKE